MGVGPLKLKLTFLLLAAAGALVATNNPSLAAKSGVASIHSRHRPWLPAITINAHASEVADHHL